MILMALALVTRNPSGLYFQLSGDHPLGVAHRQVHRGATCMGHLALSGVLAAMKTIRIGKHRIQGLEMLGMLGIAVRLVDDQ